MTPALASEPCLDPDLQKIIEAYYVLCRRRDFDSFTGRPRNISMSDIKTVHETSGWAELGMPLSEFIDWIDVLDEELVAFYSARDR